MLNGSCLCGQVRYSISSAPLLLENCHCSMCRKAHGSAYTTFAKVMKADFQFTAGSKLVKHFQSSPEVQRSFCQNCGGKFTFEWALAQNYLWIAAGTFDNDPGMKPEFHIFVSSKAEWFEINDQLPQHEGYPPATD